MRLPIARPSTDDEESEINLTPMLDIVFIMLIFFIVTATFIKESGIEVNRPEAQTAQPQQRASILIAISDRNEIWINRRKIDLGSVRANVERLHAENPQGSVVIQADKESNTDTLISVMDAVRQAGVFNISIAAQQT
ncbi:MAG: biopolymer transporter ExbD [Gammaproteobacteria bacterium]